MMNMPGFGAEASLGPAAGTYRGRTIRGGSGTGDVSMQFFGASSFASRFGFTIKCCGYSTLLRRFVCTSRSVSPLENCECQQDIFGHPLIFCRPPVASLG